MRILAIRGRNLASLAGDFEMRLDAPPLADAGLFAITGPTGSGKSTTLDALCLALFDRMPRLPGGRGVEVGRADDVPESRLRSNDVRSILRRGAGEGYAEVDFRGVDGGRYRARWSVRRARERAGGRFQAQTMELRDLSSGADLSGTKTEVLDGIQARLGLTFDQFRRSVLLAQGDFAAFLRAHAGERAELLERITGTGIYGEISKAAHRRAAEEHKRLELVRQRLGDQRPMAEQERKALDAELAAAQQARDEQLLAWQSLQQAQRWYETLDKLAAERDRAAEQLACARTEQAKAQPRRQAFERIRSLQPLRLHLIAFERADEALLAARRDLELSAAEQSTRQTEVDRAAADAATAAAAFAESEKAQMDVAPALQAARRLDTRIQGACELVERSRKDREVAQTDLKRAMAERDELQEGADKASETLGQAEDWLAAHAGIDLLVVQWEAWERELGRYTRARGVVEDTRAAIETAERAALVHAESHRALDALIARIGADRERALSDRSELEALAAGLDPDRLAVRREERLAHRAKVDQWRQLVEQARESGARIQVAGKALADEQSRRARSEARLQKIEKEILPAAAALSEAEDAYRRLLLASAGDLEALRGQLREGEPCPVCGAKEHPWADRTPLVLEGLVAEQAARVESVKRRVDDLAGGKARESAERAQARRRGGELASDLDEQRAMQLRILDTWSGCESDSLRPADPFAEGLIQRQAGEISALTESLKGIGADEAKARSLQAGIKGKIAEIEGLDARLGLERNKLAELDEQTRIGMDARGRAELERERSEESMGQVLELIAEPLAGIDGWRASLAQDPEVFVQGCRREVDLWRRHDKQRDEARRLQQDLSPRLALAQARLQGADQELTRRSAALDEQTVGLSELMRERAGLLGGESADALEARLKDTAAEARSKQEEARNDLARSRELLTAARGAVATRRQALQRFEDVAAGERQVLDAQMAGQGVGLDELREALERDHDWIEKERLALQALRDACDRSQELLKERERRLDEHRFAELTDLSPEELAERLPLADETLSAAQEHWGRLHGRLSEDERRRETSRETRAELERQQAVWELWESLRELIGSADGSKFRNFAQGLTLNLLVAHANEHLRDLARRYELQRVPGAEMEIQVIDREMGDEVRSIHSLSGGESFLASLALALGLASLASDRVEVESLFIDEGFGALDADSLDLAIASLDALYSLGRQVGVISHVDTLVERIGVKVQVTKQGGGRSRLKVVTD